MFGCSPITYYYFNLAFDCILSPTYTRSMSLACLEIFAVIFPHSSTVSVMIPGRYSFVIFAPPTNFPISLMAGRALSPSRDPSSNGPCSQLFNFSSTIICSSSTSFSWDFCFSRLSFPLWSNFFNSNLFFYRPNNFVQNCD